MCYSNYMKKWLQFQNNETLVRLAYGYEQSFCQNNTFVEKKKGLYEPNKGLILVVLLYKKGKLGLRSKLLNSQNNKVNLCVAYES